MMGTFGSNKSGQEMQNFNEFTTGKTVITEEEKTYRYVYLWYDDPEDPDDPEATADDFIKEGDSVGLKGFKVDVQGAYSDLEDGVRYIYDGMTDKKERKFRIDENTLVFVRAPVTKRKAWSDFLTQLERAGVVCVNTRACMEITSDKYRTSLYLAEAELAQPKTVLVHHPEKAIPAMERLGGKYPVILKTLTGSLGIGVIKVDSESSLHSTVQLLYKLDPNMGVLLQEMIKDLKITDRVHLHGFIQPFQIASLLKDVDVFVAPFDSSGRMPYVAHTKLMEYASWKRPMILPDMPVVREHFSQGNHSLFFKEGQLKSLVECIEEMKSIEKRKILQKAFSKEIDFSWKKRSQKYIEILRSL